MEDAAIQIERIIQEENLEIMSVRWNLDDSMLSVGCSDGSIKIYSSEGLIRSLYCQRASESMPITSMRWKPTSGKTKNVLIATTCDGGIFQFHASSGRLMHHDTLVDNQAYSCDYKPDSTFFAIGCKDTSVRIFDENSKVMVAQLGPSYGYNPGHNSRVFSIKWFSENALVSAGWDNKVILWDIRQRQIAREIFGPHISGDAVDVKNEVLLTGSYHQKDQLQLWDLGSGRNLFSTKLLNGDKECLLYTAQFSKIGEIIACGGSGSDEGYFFNANPVTPLGVIANLTKPVYSIDFCNNSQKVAVGCGDGSVVICKINANL